MPAFPQAAEIEATLELLAERCEDPTPLVYARLFAAQPRMQAHFWRDQTGAIKGEMLSRTFEAILDFIGDRRYAHHMVKTELVTHEGYDIPREIFVTFFGYVRDTVRDVLAEAWTPAHEAAWTALIADIHAYTGVVPHVQDTTAYHAGRIAEFEASYLAKG